MKQLLAAVLVCLLVCGLLLFAAAEETPQPLIMCEEAAERVRKNQHVTWAGGKYLLLGNELVCAEDNSTVLSSADRVYPLGRRDPC